jgi:host factor-I protein
MSKQNNIQDIFLNTARKEKIALVVYLTNGVPLKGKVKSFDNFTVILDTEKGQNLIYKHAISTIQPQKPISLQGEDSDKISEGDNRE